MKNQQVWRACKEQGRVTEEVKVSGSSNQEKDGATRSGSRRSIAFFASPFLLAVKSWAPRRFRDIANDSKHVFDKGRI